MDLPTSQAAEKEVLSQAEVERLLAQVAEQESSAVVHQADGPKKSQPRDSIQPYDFRCPVFLSANELRKLRLQHEAFIQALAARLSIYLRVEFGLQMSQLQTMTYQKFIDGLPNPCHLTLFKVDPLRGICILDVNPRLGLTIIDRLMGGPGHSISVNRDLSEIEMALLEQAVRLVIGEWCNHWGKIQELRPVLLGHENSGRFLQTSQPDAVMLALSMEARMGDCVEPIQIGFPYTTLEPLIRGLSQKLNQHNEEAIPANGGKPKWSRDFDDIKVPVVADFPGITVSARKLTQLKVGDVIPLPADFATGVQLRLAKIPRFVGRLGSADGHSAVELSRTLPT
ncbi:MAG: FliM/FliN family flagellar motor switch protein [Verrucomicrobiota bacterium]